MSQERVPWEGGEESYKRRQAGAQASAIMERLLREDPAVYTFVRWDRREPPPAGTIARPRDLKYYMRVANCGNGITASRHR